MEAIFFLHTSGSEDSFYCQQVFFCPPPLRTPAILLNCSKLFQVLASQNLPAITEISALSPCHSYHHFWRPQHAHGCSNSNPPYDIHSHSLTLDPVISTTPFSKMISSTHTNHYPHPPSSLALARPLQHSRQPVFIQTSKLTIPTSSCLSFSFFKFQDPPL